jgi:hypothetical protein
LERIGAEQARLGRMIKRMINRADSIIKNGLWPIIAILPATADNLPVFSTTEKAVTATVSLSCRMA